MGRPDLGRVHTDWVLREIFEQQSFPPVRCQIPVLDLAWSVSSLETVSVRTECQDSESHQLSDTTDHTKMAPPVADLKAMTDAFEGIDRLAEGAPRTEGAPNFRRVSGVLVVSSVTSPAQPSPASVM